MVVEQRVSLVNKSCEHHTYTHFRKEKYLQMLCVIEENIIIGRLIKRKKKMDSILLP